MARSKKYQLTWCGGTPSDPRKRWQKKYRKKVYWFNVQDGESKEESYRRCWQKWVDRKAVIDGEFIATQPAVIAVHRLMLEVQGKLDALRAISNESEPAKTLEEAEQRGRLRAEYRFAEQQLKSYSWFLEHGVHLEQHTLGGWPDRDEQDTTAPWIAADQSVKPKTLTLPDLVNKYLAHKITTCSAGRFSNIRVYLEKLTARVKQINAVELRDYRDYVQSRVQSGQLSDSSGSDALQITRQFLQWSYDNEYIDELPRLINRDYSIKVEPQAVKTFTDEEIQTLLEKTSKRTKLYILLALNTGMTQQDIADLKHEEVDWETGYITRKRSKTKHHENAPTVRYRLWDETFSLLSGRRSLNKKRVLLNQFFEPLLTRELNNGRLKKCDSIASAFDRLRKETGIDLSFKYLRKTAASKLDENAEYARYSQFFLGHSGTNQAERHYLKPSQPQFDAAVTWLGEQFNDEE